MPITNGPLTQRLNQVVTDVVASNIALGLRIDAITEKLTQLMQPAPADGVTTLTNLQYQLVSAANSLTNINARDSLNIPQMKAAIEYLTQAGDGTALGSNLYSLGVEVFELGGARPNHATLWTVMQAVNRLLGVDGPDQENITSVYNELRSLNIAMGTFDALGEPITDRQVQLLQQIAICVCELNGKTPTPASPIPPPATVLGAEFGCAQGGVILWTITPASWVNTSPIGWHAAPLALSQAAIAGGYSLTNVTEDTSGQSVAVVAALGEAQDPLNCFITGDNQTFSINTVTRRDLIRQATEPNYYRESSGTFVDNVYKGSCRPSPIWSQVSTRKHWYYDALLPIGTAMPPNCNIYFYSFAATPPPEPASACVNPASTPAALSFDNQSASGSSFWDGGPTLFNGRWSTGNAAFANYLGSQGNYILVLPGPRWYRIEAQLDPTAERIIVDVAAPGGSGASLTIDILANSSTNIQTRYFFVPASMSANVTALLPFASGTGQLAPFDSRVTVGFCIDPPSS